MSGLLMKMTGLRLILAACLLFVLGGFLQAQTLPPKPDRYITDQAGVIDGAALDRINSQLDQFERNTSNQILVAIYPKLPDDAEIAQYATDTYNSWQVGQKGKDNGAILFVFVQSHKMFIVTGRGLEGALPDAICKRIVTQILTPAFRQSDFAGGVQGGVNAMIAATKGEFKGTDSTHEDRHDSGQGIPSWLIVLIIIAFIFAQIFIFPRFSSGPMIYTGGGWGGGGGGGGFGDGGGFGGGGFSGGGGSSAGGGAGGSW